MRIVKLNIGNRIQTLKRGGGTPPLNTPQSLDGLKKIRSDLLKIFENNKQREKFIIVLFHQDKNVPAITKRFCGCMCNIFGSNKFNYERNTMSAGGLGFHYVVTQGHLEMAIERLNIIIDFMESELETTTLDQWFNTLKNKKPGFEMIENRLQRHLREKMNCISKTSLIELLSRSAYNYKEILLADDEYKITTTGTNIICSFINKDFTDKGVQHIKDEGIPILYKGNNLVEIQLPTNKQIELSGLSVEPFSSPTFSSNNLSVNNSDLVECLFENLEKDVELNHVAVGVIDGGINTNSKILKKVKYKSFTDLGIAEEPHYKNNNDNHAEMVTSILLWAPKLSDRTTDNCRQPDVTLFDIIRDGMSPGEFLKILELIIEKYYKEIHIWNFSLNFQHWRNGDTWSKGVTELGIKFDELQKKYNVLFIISTGNKDTEDDNEYILTPSDCVRGISVSASLPNGKPVDYSLDGQSTKNLYYTSKPDLSTTGCDSDGYYRVIKDNFFANYPGVSFAVPLVTRKVAELFANGFDLNMIPAILNCIACHHAKSIDDYLGYGVLPMSINEILDMRKTNALITFSINPKNYSQGFFKLKLPKDAKGNYPLSFTFSANVVANTSPNSSFEYVEDTARVQIGAVEPGISSNRLIQHTKIKIIEGDDDNSFTDDDTLRRVFGKYKNRYCCKRESVRSLSGFKNTGTDLMPIEYFGVTITRNDLRSTRKGDLMTHVCLLVSSINGMEILDEINVINRELIDITLDIDKSDDIKFN